ncbi:alpha/beta hydrolase [Levilactobacillus bambusae]|uniref:Alpha/beta hydrolase n=1 Tax=Levilactobacillus bambusae TaxID=2024736 RepID=A0A2V1N2D2_9LACO|nr:alpha/beta hydrolase [Levilactobacillus bambusae]PWG00455.1 alpha/beta hydrolase [Levilactobacillus bambusae]
MTTYQNQRAWREVESFLPEKYHYTTHYHPTEEDWDWHNNTVHLDTFRNPDAKAKIIMFHGVGTNGRQISMIMGGPMALENFETICVDMPTYGVTDVDPHALISYDDWVQCGSDLIDVELTKDDRPIFLYGLSAGGMETYHVAARNKKVKGIIGMTFLDQRSKDVQMTTTNNWFWGEFGVPLTGIATHIGLSGFKMKMSIPSKMRALVNDPQCLKVMLNDPTSGGNKVTMKFMNTYMTYAPDVEPENFTVCPVLLTQPDTDRWTPERLSDPFLDKLTQVKVTKTTLRNGGHYPIEATALDDLHTVALDFINDNL